MDLRAHVDCIDVCAMPYQYPNQNPLSDPTGVHENQTVSPWPVLHERNDFALPTPKTASLYGIHGSTNK